MAKSKKGGVGDRLMDGAVGFGKFQIWVGIILFGFLAVLAFFGGVYFVFAEDVPVVKGKAVVAEDSQCSIVHTDNGSRRTCSTTVSYQVDGKDYKISVTSDKEHFKGTEIDIEWELGKPDTATLCCRTKNATIGYILLGVSIFLGGAAGLNYYFRNNEFYAAASGASVFR